MRFAEKKEFFRRGIRFVPFLFTLGNAFFGFCSIALAIEGERIAAIYCIFLAALMDALDGRVARLMKVESDLGVEMDSLCDAISFCLAPAFLVYIWSLRYHGFLGIVVCSIFLLAGVLRLARFNLTHDDQSVFFAGLPTTIAGCFLSLVLLNSMSSMGSGPDLINQPWFTTAIGLLVILLSWLMISSIPFPAFKSKPGKSRKKVKKQFLLLGAVVLFAVMTVMRLELLSLLLFGGYFLLAVIYIVKEKL